MAQRPINARVDSVKKMGRAKTYARLPPERDNVPEYAVFGISNVGKSSLINFLLGGSRRSLTDVSRHPGATTRIQHLLVNDSFYLVDLPGIGWAERSGSVREQMDTIIRQYLEHRRTLHEVLYLVDGSLPPRPLDLKCIQWLASGEVPMSVVFTKVDKKLKGAARRSEGGPIALLSQALMELPAWQMEDLELPKMFMTSVKDKLGRKEVLDHLTQMRKEWLVGHGIAQGKINKRVLSVAQKIKLNDEAREALIEATREPPPGIR